MSTARYARNGALAGIGLYLMVAIPFLGLSLSSTASPHRLPAATWTIQADGSQGDRHHSAG